MSSPFVVIDDTNSESSIQYFGPWFKILTTQDDTLSYGSPFENTLHGVNVTAYFSFPFSGSAVVVYGTSITTNASGTQDPTWECFIDNISIGWSPAPSTNENNWILCGGGPSQFQDGSHLLTVKANVTNRQTFWFDYIQYTPSASVSLNQSILRIDSSDSVIQYSSGWQSSDEPISYTQFSENTSYTQITGATLTYQFSGTLISWVGYMPQPGIPALSTYIIDGKTPTSFLVPASSNTYFNQFLFRTELPYGRHKLVVTYNGNSTTVPLALNYLILHGALSSDNTPTSSSIPSGSLSNPSPTSSTAIHRKPTGAIIGGVMGGLILILFLLILFFVVRRRNNRKSQALSEMTYTDPFPDVVTPFTDPPSNPTSAFLPHNYTSDDQSLHWHPQPISSKFAQRDQPSDPPSTSAIGRIQPLAPLRPHFSSTAFISPLSSLPLSGSQTNFDDTRTGIPQTATEPSTQRSESPSPREANARFLLHEDSGVRIPSEDDVFELPPLYTPG